MLGFFLEGKIHFMMTSEGSSNIRVWREVRHKQDKFQKHMKLVCAGKTASHVE
jgi:hypothetical protein